MEYYADVRTSHWARCYTSLLLTRRLVFVVIVLLVNFISSEFVFSLLLGIQLLYLGVLLMIRPFEEIENNLVELTNEMFFLVFIVLMLI